MKTLRNILSFTFLSFFMLMTIGAPYYMHTCSISLQKDVHLFVTSVCEDVEEHCDFHTSCHSQEASSEAEDCCDEEKGYVSFDYDGPAVDIAIQKVFFTFVAIGPAFEFQDFSSENSKFNHHSNAPPIFSSGRDIRLSLQSILC